MVILLRRITWFGFLAVAVPVVLLAPLVALDATLRKLFSVVLPGTLEITEYSLFVITFMAGPWILRLRKQVCLDTLVTLTAGRIRATIEAIGFGIGAVASALMVWQGTLLVLQAFQDGTQLHGYFAIRAFWLYWIIPTGALIYTIEFCSLAIESFQITRKTPDDLRKTEATP